MRLVVIALSEASPQLIEKFCSLGQMPNLQKLRDRGMSGLTRYSTPYLLTPQMWATVLTGRGAGSHGVFDYWQRGHNGSFFETTGKQICGPRIWDELSENEIQCGFINVPMTYPPPQVCGFALSGQDAPGAHPSIAHPRRLYKDLRRRFGRYHYKDIFPSGQSKREYGLTLSSEVAWQSEMFDWLARRHDWQFLMLYSSGTAFAQHYFWSDMESGEGPNAKVIDQVFRAVDVLIGRITDALRPEDLVFVISECGAGPLVGGVRLNELLRQETFLNYLSKTDAPSARAKSLWWFRTKVRNILPRNTDYIVNLLPLKGWIQEAIASDRIDWSRTVAFHRGKGEGNIYLNVKGRDPKGCLPLSDYESTRAAIVERLRHVRDPRTGEKAIAAVHRREEIFTGDCVQMAPDLIVEWKGFRYMPSEDLASSREVFGSRTREYMHWPTSGSHRPEGILVAAGEGFRRGRLKAPFELVDLAPTWLDLLGCPIPEAMEGKSMADTLRSTLAY